MLSTTQSAPTAEVPSKRREAVDSKVSCPPLYILRQSIPYFTCMIVISSCHMSTPRVFKLCAPQAQLMVAKNARCIWQAGDDLVPQVSEQKERPSSSGNREEISVNLGVTLAKNSVAARYDPMMRWKAETPNEEPWSSLGQFQGIRQSSWLGRPVFPMSVESGKMSL